MSKLVTVPSFVRHVLFMLFAMVCVGLVASTGASAVINPLDTACEGDNSSSQICKDKGTKLFGPGSPWTNIVNTMIYVVGAVAVVMIVIGGLKYTLANGDQNAIKGAKDTILYSIVGVVIAVSAYAIVNFVLSRI